MLPRVAFEYGHTWWAACTICSATARSTPGIVIFSIQAELKVTIPGVVRAVAEQIVQGAHQVCPYSNATRGNIDVTLTVV